MLELLGYDSLDALIDATVPAAIRLKRPLAIHAALSEHEALANLRAISQEEPGLPLVSRARLLRLPHAAGRSSATCSRTPAGTRRTRRIRPRSRRDGSRRC